MKSARGLHLSFSLGAAAVAGALAPIHPLIPLGVAVGLLAAAFMLQSAFSALVVFIAVLFSRPADFFPQLASLQPAKLFALSALGLFVLGKLLRKDGRFAVGPPVVWFFILLVGAGMSAALSSNRPESIAQFRDVFLKIALVYLLIINLVHTPQRAWVLQVAIGVICAGLGAYALYSSAMGLSQIEGSRAALVGLLGDPNDLALTLLMPAGFLLVATLDPQMKSRSFFALLALLALGGIVSTLSRGGMLGLALCGYFAMRTRIRSRLVIGSVVAVGLVGVLLFSGITERQSGAVGHEGMDESAQGRLDAWKAGGRMFIRHPLFGVGFGRFAENFDAYANNPVFWGYHETHNSYIKVASESGLAGLVPFMALILLGMFYAWELWRKSDSFLDARHRALARSSLCNLSGFLVSSFFLSQCWGWFIYILIAQVVVHHRVLLSISEGESS
jgi:O-antigen ligase